MGVMTLYCMHQLLRCHAFYRTRLVLFLSDRRVLIFIGNLVHRDQNVILVILCDLHWKHVAGHLYNVVRNSASMMKE